VKIDPSDTRQYEGIIAYGSAYKMGLSNGQLVFTLFGIVDVLSGLYIPLGEWHHVATVWEPGVGVTFYLDGGAPFAIAETRTIRTPLNNILGVGSEGLANPIMAALDRVRVHKAALPVDQLDSIAATPKPVYDSTLVAYNFSETSLPFQNAKQPDRPAISYNNYLEKTTKPSFSTDSPSGLKNDYSLGFAPGQRVVVPDPNTILALDQANPSFTLQAWVKFRPQTIARSVFFYNNAPGGALSFSVTQDRRVFVTTLGIVDQTSTAYIPNDGGWHHIAVVHENAKELRFFVDGLLGATVAYTRGVIFTRTNLVFYFGSEPTGGLQYVGSLDRFRFTKGALAANQLDFWPVPGVEPAPPTLGIETAVKVSWPTIPAGYALQKTTDLNEPRTWLPVTNAPFAENLKFNVFLPITEQKTFYRLIKP
jgi:hypothetical protein